MSRKPNAKKTFSEMIIARVEADPDDKSYISHIIEYCDKEEIPYDKMQHYVNRDLKERLRLEGVGLNMVLEDDEEEADEGL